MDCASSNLHWRALELFIVFFRPDLWQQFREILHKARMADVLP